MVQIDVFWSYGFGATFALMAARSIKKEYEQDPEGSDKNQFYTKPYVLNLIFLSCFFVPSGIWLLWGWPDWETMMVFPDHESIPFWLVTAFAVTNVTQGILAYWLTRRHLKQGAFYKGYLHFWGANFLFWFVLFYGWDGSGIFRFFGTSYESFHNGQTWTDWFFSTPSWGLMALGPLVMIPLFILWQKLWDDDLLIEREAKEGVEAAAQAMPKAALRKLKINSFGGYMLATVISCQGLAATVGLMLYFVPFVVSVPAALIFIYLTAIKINPLNLNYRFYKAMMNIEDDQHKLALAV